MWHPQYYMHKEVYICDGLQSDLLVGTYEPIGVNV